MLRNTQELKERLKGLKQAFKNYKDIERTIKANTETNEILHQLYTNFTRAAELLAEDADNYFEHEPSYNLNNDWRTKKH